MTYEEYKKWKNDWEIMHKQELSNEKDLKTGWIVSERHRHMNNHWAIKVYEDLYEMSWALQEMANKYLTKAEQETEL